MLAKPGGAQQTKKGTCQRTALHLPQDVPCASAPAHPLACLTSPMHAGDGGPPDTSCGAYESLLAGHTLPAQLQGKVKRLPASAVGCASATHDSECSLSQPPPPRQQERQQEQDQLQQQQRQLSPHDDCWNNLLKGNGSPVLHVGRPLAYVECTCTEDVVQAVRFASRHQLKVQARGNGHHYGGAWLVDDGLVLDLSHMKAIHVDPVTRTAVVQPGVTTAELREATIMHGLHFPGGHISSVGISGLILGGGNGWGVRHCGAAADCVSSFEVVTLAEGLAKRVDAETDAELFWGLKGAGMFLGIVTEFVLKLHPVPQQLPCITAIYPLHTASKVGALFKSIHDSSPIELEVSLCMTHIPCTDQSGIGDRDLEGVECGGLQQPQQPPPVHHPGMQPVVIIGCVGFLPGASPTLEPVRAALRAFAPEERVMLEEQELPYAQALACLDASWNWPGLCLFGHGTFVKEEQFDEGLVKVLQQHCAAASSPRSLLLVAPGAPRGMPAAAYGFRGSFYVAAYAMWPRTEGGPEEDGDTAHAAWVRAMSVDAKPWVQGCYLNEVMLTESGQAEKCFEADTLVRLRELKGRVDPHCLLRRL